MTISDTQRLILTAAAQHADGIVVPPVGLPPAPRSTVAKALLQAGLVAPADCEPSDPSLVWKPDGKLVALRITEAGRRALGAKREIAAEGLVVSPAPEAEAAAAEAMPALGWPGLRERESDRAVAVVEFGEETMIGALGRIDQRDQLQITSVLKGHQRVASQTAGVLAAIEHRKSGTGVIGRVASACA